MLTWVAAFVAGIIGSGHCGAMCGGIASALGMRGRGAADALLNQCGRITSYALAGALAGGIGTGFGALLQLQGWTLGLRAAAGVLVAVVGVQLITGQPLLRFVERFGSRFWQKLAPVAQRQMAGRTAGNAFAFGLLWGWLPCGLVYSMLLAAAVSGGPLQGAGLMAAFGFGTLPALMGFAVGGRSVTQFMAQRGPRRAAGALLLVLGLWTALAPWLMHSATTGLLCHT